MAYPIDESESESTPTNALGAWLRQTTQRSQESSDSLERLRQQNLSRQYMPKQPGTPVFTSRKTDFNVWDSFDKGFSAMMDAAQRRRKAMEGLQAMERLGQQKYLPGYEGVQGAEMPIWLGKLYAANP